MGCEISLSRLSTFLVIILHIPVRYYIRAILLSVLLIFFFFYFFLSLKHVCSIRRC